MKEPKLEPMPFTEGRDSFLSDLACALAVWARRESVSLNLRPAHLSDREAADSIWDKLGRTEFGLMETMATLSRDELVYVIDCARNYGTLKQIGVKP